MRILDAMPGITRTSIFGTALHAVTESDLTGPDDIASRLHAEGLTGVSCAVVAPSLEDVFLDVAERSAS
jgi:hypothetical protein